MRTDPPTTQTMARFLRQSLLGMGVWTTATAVCAQAVLPSGGQVVSGQASIEAANGAMIVRQSTNQAIVNWDAFNVGRDQSVQFIAPSAQSTTFNRILDANPSQIMGRIQANGQLIFSNPQGVVFGATAQVDVGGLVVTVHNLSNDDFLAGRWHFTGGTPGARVENAGRLQAELGGYIALLAPEVRNDGVVLAREGTVAMAAGEAVTLQFAGSRRLSVVVNTAVMNALVSNRHVIRADGGVVVLSARSANAILESVIQQSGQVTAQSLVNQNGRILLQGGERGVVTVEGQLDARGAEASARGGEILVTGDKVFVGAAARLEASGAAGGGEVLVGGGWQGQDTRLTSANAVVVASGARLDASATERGDGGTVVVWSDTANPKGVTRVAGDLRARGGPKGGDGGRIETSGANLDVRGVTGDASAPMGVSGEWLFDPYNVTITSATVNGAMTSDVNNGSTWTPSANNSTILNTTINTLLDAGTDVTVTTTGAGVQDGDIVVDAAITRSTTTGRATLSLTADRNITINQAINIAGSGSLLQLTAGGSDGTAVGFRAPVTVDTLVVNASGTGAINQGATAGAAALTVTNLGLNAPLAAVDLKTNQIVSGATITNSLGTVAANVLSLDLLAGTGVSVANASHGRGVYVGTVSSLSGLTTSTGALNLRVTDTNLYVNSNVVAGGNLVLNAGSVSGLAETPSSAANIIVSDTASISTGGQGLLYTGAVAQGSTNLLRLVLELPGSVTNSRFRYNSNEESHLYSSELVLTDLHVIYREQPTLTASIGSLSRTYGSTDDIGLLTPSVSGLLNGDTQAQAYTSNPTVTVSSALYSNSSKLRAGTYTLTASSGVSGLGYATAGGTSTLEVAAKALTTEATGNSRTYNALTTASARLFNDKIGDDDVTSSSTGAIFESKNVGVGKAITVGGISISGADSGNYTVANTTASTTADITALGIAATYSMSSSRVYDGSTAATVAADVSSGVLSGDTVTASATGVFVNKNVGTGTTVMVSGALAGADSGNYSLSNQTGSLSSAITVRPLSVSALADDKVYDATTAVTYSLSSNKITGDSLSLNSTSGVFSDKNLGVNKLVTVAGISLSGNDAANYQLINTSTQSTADITAYSLSLNPLTAQPKVYDGTTVGTISGTLSVTPLLGDDVGLLGASSYSATFSDKHVGESKTVTVSHAGTLSGADAGNYTLNSTASTTADITAKPITVTGITAANKVYDGGVSATVSTAALDQAYLEGTVGVVSNDSLTVFSTGVFADKNAASGKTVTLTSTYGGADVANYSITSQPSTTADITAKPITVTGITAANKVYDGGVSATVSTAALDQAYLEGTVGVVSNDSLTVSSTGVFADKNTASGKTVTLTSTYGGADVANYSITDQASPTADVTPRGLTIVGVSALDKFYDGSNVAFANVGSSTLSGLVAGDDVLLSSSGVFLDAAVGGNKPVLLTNTLAGNDLSNYSVTNQDTTSASIFERVSIPVVPTATQTVVQFSPTTVRFVPQPVAVASAAPAVTLPVSATSQLSSVADAGVSTTSAATAADAGTTATTATGTSPVVSTPTATEGVATSVAEAAAQAVEATPASAATLPATSLSSLPSSVAQSIPAETLQAMSPAQVSSVLASLNSAQAAALTTEQAAQVGDLFAAASDALGASTTASAAAATATPAALQQASPGEVLALLPSLPAEARAALSTETLEAVQALISQALEAEKPTSESMGLGVGSRLAGASLPLSEVPQLTPDALLALTAQDMAAWDAAALQQLTAAQVATLPVETLAGLSAAQLAALDATQLQGLSASQLADVSALLTPAQLADLTTAQKTAARDVLASTVATPASTEREAATTVTPAAASSTAASPGSTAQEAGASSLPGSAPRDLASLLLSPSALSVEQLAALPLGTWQQLDPLIIQQLSPTVIASVPLAAMVTWSPEQIAALRGVQLSALSIPQLRVVYLLLAPAQFAQLPAAQVAGLRLSQRFVWVSRVGRNPGLLQSLLAAVQREAGLVATQNLADLSPREASRLSAVSIQQLGAAQIALLRPAVFSALSDQQVRALRPEQIALLNPNQLSSVLPWLSSGQVRAITPEQLSGLRNLVALN